MHAKLIMLTMYRLKTKKKVKTNFTKAKKAFSNYNSQFCG